MTSSRTISPDSASKPPHPGEPVTRWMSWFHALVKALRACWPRQDLQERSAAETRAHDIRAASIAERERAVWDDRWVKDTRGVTRRRRVLVRTFPGRVVSRHPPRPEDGTRHRVSIDFPPITGGKARVGAEVCVVRVSRENYARMFPGTEWGFEFFSANEGVTWRPLQEDV